jgi:hypothetical protein
MLVNPYMSYGGGGGVTGDFFVATTGNDSNPGTEVSPWATIGHAATQATAGDVVVVSGGTYHESDIAMSADGTPTDPITFVNKTGETPIIDGSMSAYRTSGNSAWEVSDATRHIYRTTTTLASPGDFGYTGRIDVAGTIYMLTAYVDLAHLSADDDLFDVSNPYYMGPGITYHTDSHIYIRLDPNSAEAQWNLVAPLVIADLDPRNHAIYLAPNNGGFNISGDYIVIDGLEVRHHWTSFGGTGTNVTVQNVTMWPSRFGARLDANNWTFDACDIEFHLSPWIARSDVKSGVEPAKDTRTGGISFESTHFHTLNNCTLTGAFDAMLALGDNHDLTITNCLIDNAQDDGCQTGSAAYNIEFGHCTWLGAGPSHDGSGTDAASTPDSFYVHHCVFDNTGLVFWSRKPIPGNDPAENGTEGYHHPPIFSSHSVPDFDDPWKIYNCTFVAAFTPGIQGVNHYMYHGDAAGLGKHEAFNLIINFTFDTRVYRGANANSGLEDFDYIIYAFDGAPTELFAIESVKANGASAATTSDFTTWKADMGWDAHSTFRTTLVPLDGSYRPTIAGPADGTGVNLSAKGWPGTTPGTTYIGAKAPV